MSKRTKNLDELKAQVTRMEHDLAEIRRVESRLFGGTVDDYPCHEVEFGAKPCREREGSAVNDSGSAPSPLGITDGQLTRSSLAKTCNACLAYLYIARLANACFFELRTAQMAVVEAEQAQAAAARRAES